MKWEYMQRYAFAVKPDYLNSLGADSWELVAILSTSTGGYWLVFKRPLP